MKALAKPTASAWAVNQLFWQHRDAFDELIEAGARFRQAQTALLAGQPADLREPLLARGRALTEMTRHAATALRSANHHPTPVLMRRITITLEALSAYGASAQHARPGRLTKDVDPPGFDALAALVPRVGGPPKGSTTTSRLLAFDRPPADAPSSAMSAAMSSSTTPAASADERRALERARKLAVKAAGDALGRAEAARGAARAALSRAEDTMRRAVARAKEAEAAQMRAEQSLEQASAKAEAARSDARGLTAAAVDAADALTDAERLAEMAQAELSRLDQRLHERLHERPNERLDRRLE